MSYCRAHGLLEPCEWCEPRAYCPVHHIVHITPCGAELPELGVPDEATRIYIERRLSDQRRATVRLIAALRMRCTVQARHIQILQERADGVAILEARIAALESRQP
jgi:hypothetical protein